MTVDITKNTVTATATGAAGETVTVDYLFFANDELQVYIEDQTTGAVGSLLTLDTDYSVTGKGVSTGGTVKMITQQTAGDKIHVDRWLTALQGTKYKETGKFPAASHETALDKLTMMVQQVLGRMGGQAFSAGFTQFMSRLATNIKKWDAKTSIIANVKDPDDNQDAATKAFVVSLISASGNLPAPDDPADDGKILVAGSGGVTYQNFRVPTPAAGDDERILEGTGVGEGGFTFADLGRRNYLINGGFTVNQRGGTYTAATTPGNSDSIYLIDRWVLLSDGNDVVDVSQDLTAANKPTGAYASLRSLVATANLKWGYLQILEARDAAALIGGTVSLSFDVIGSGIANVRAAVLAWDGTADSVTRDVVSAWGLVGVNPTLVSNWTFENTPANLAVTGSVVRHKIEGISVDQSGATNVAIFIWVDDTDAAVSDTLNISNVQLERSATAHAFVPHRVQDELAWCQRYYSQSYDEGVIRGTSDEDGMENFEAAGVAGTINVAFPVRMRIAPITVTTFSRTGVADEARRIGTTDVTDLVVQATGSGRGDRSMSIKYGGVTVAIDNTSYGWHWTAAAEL